MFLGTLCIYVLVMGIIKGEQIFAGIFPFPSLMLRLNESSFTPKVRSLELKFSTGCPKRQKNMGIQWRIRYRLCYELAL